MRQVKPMKQLILAEMGLLPKAERRTRKRVFLSVL